MARQTSEEVRVTYIESMGQDLGQTFFELYRKLVQLHIIWQQYRQLFGTNNETIQLLNRTSGLFFKVVQDELWDSVLLGISRMTDPPATGNNKNLTIFSLLALIEDSDFRGEVEDLCKAANTQAKFARDHRNKRIAHQDFDYEMERSANALGGISRALVEEMLEALRNVLNHVDHQFRDTTVMYQQFVDASGARVLVNKLRAINQHGDM